MKKLRNALAISQARKLLSTLRQEAEGTVTHDQSNRFAYLNELYSRIHRELFYHWKEQASADTRPGTMTNTDKGMEVRTVMESLVLNGEDSKNTAIFDNNGFVINAEDIAVRLARFYKAMRKVRPFAYGNKLTLDFFMTALGILPAFRGVYERGIDFRRLEHEDAIALHNPKSGCEEIILAFQHAIDPARNKFLENKPNGYGKWPENKKYVFGIPFLSHSTSDGIECLVTVNGGLVPLDSINKELKGLIISRTHFGDYPRSVSDNVIGYLPGTEGLREPGRKDIDGINLGVGGVAPLFCLDVNILTGLRFPSHTELTELLKQCEGNKATLFDLANNEWVKNKLLAAAEGNDRLKRTVNIAFDRLSAVSIKLDRCKNAIFRSKTPDTNPKLFMCMGGTGSGKTAVEEMAKALCGDNFVIASLDEFRKESDLYKVLTAANHHSDDYIYIEPFANRLRDLVSTHAKEQSINVLYDGTGIPYKPRYSRIVDAFKEYGFETQLISMDAFIVKPEGRDEELSRSDVIASVKDRFEKTGRALPWVVTVDKHIRAPGSFLDALEHSSLDKISLFANDGDMDKHYLVAESFAFSDEEVRELQEQHRTGNLAPYLKLLIKNMDSSILRNLAKGEATEIDELINRNRTFFGHNVAYQIFRSKSGNRVLAVYNAHRMQDFIEKVLLNPNASSEDGLLHKRGSLAFHVDPSAPKPWIAKLQSLPVKAGQ